MGAFRYQIVSSLRSITRSASVCVLSTAICMAPATVNAAGLDPSAAFTAAKGLQGMAGPLSSAIGATTAAQGANSMAKGKQQMACCKEGCDGAGKEATANKAAQDGAAQGAGKAIQNMSPGGSSPQAPSAPRTQESGPAQMSPTGWNRYSKPAENAFLCMGNGSKAKMLFDLFRPARAEAVAGCNDAMMSMAQGAMQMLQGLMGLMAGKESGKQAATNGSNLGNLTEAAPSQVAGSNIGNGTGNTTPIKIDPSLLREGKAASVFNEFEKNFGIPREDFANALLNGADPRSLLMNAPKNAFTADEMNMAFSAAKNMSQEQKDAAMAGMNELSRDLASTVPVDPISTAGKSASRSSSSKELDDMADLLGAEKAPDAATSLAGDRDQLSPEIQAALADRDTAQMRAASSIFQVVHRKYQEKFRMIYGFDSRGRSIGGKGVANADGF